MAKASSESINWTEGLILKTFGLNRILEGYPLLQEWLTVEDNLVAEDLQQLEKRRMKLRQRKLPRPRRLHQQSSS